MYQMSVTLRDRCEKSVTVMEEHTSGTGFSENLQHSFQTNNSSFFLASQKGSILSGCGQMASLISQIKPSLNLYTAKNRNFVASPSLNSPSMLSAGMSFL